VFAKGSLTLGRCELGAERGSLVHLEGLAVDERRTWLLIGSIALVGAMLLVGFLWLLDSAGTSGGEPSEGMTGSGLLLPVGVAT